MNKGGTVMPPACSVTMVHADHSAGESGRVAGARLPRRAGRLRGRARERAAGVPRRATRTLFGDMALIGELHRPGRGASCPSAATTRWDPRAAAKAVELLGVTTVVPIHYGTFPVLAGTPDELRAELADLGSATCGCCRRSRARSSAARLRGRPGPASGRGPVQASGRGLPGAPMSRPRCSWDASRAPSQRPCCVACCVTSATRCPSFLRAVRTQSWRRVASASCSSRLADGRRLAARRAPTWSAGVRVARSSGDQLAGRRRERRRAARRGPAPRAVAAAVVMAPSPTTATQWSPERRPPLPRRKGPMAPRCRSRRGP